MNETKHTPGPWTARDDSSAAGIEIMHSYNIGPEEREDIVVCTLLESDYEGRSEEELTANIQLITAAPELLKALKFLRIQACQLGDFMYGAVRECSADMIRAIDAAITKAEGRA